MVGGVIKIKDETALWMAFTGESVRFCVVSVVSDFALTSFLAASAFERLSIFFVPTGQTLDYV